MIYHIIEKHDYEELLRTGRYHPGSLDAEGFIHCSGNEADALAVANNFYAGKDILVLEIDEGLLNDMLRWEAPSHDIFAGLFPHVYGEIEIRHLAGAKEVTVKAGRFTGWNDD